MRACIDDLNITRLLVIHRLETIVSIDRAIGLEVRLMASFGAWRYWGLMGWCSRRL